MLVRTRLRLSVCMAILRRMLFCISADLVYFMSSLLLGQYHCKDIQMILMHLQITGFFVESHVSGIKIFTRKRYDFIDCPGFAAIWIPEVSIKYALAHAVPHLSNINSVFHLSIPRLKTEAHTLSICVPS